ncbi:PREDICTED: coiled-coil and C2 domain-containing protein 1-like isoform X2 [Polistes canadensis]|uniref:coiled-coil and C2 domain-containing protein 1-like isoform X2 n=1 Tax=Polistes canadensis TaxID=91411 RepID=UPI000718EF9A|nr:PREDICTED: coiled-coil and C2 domain-containing protein 1-like isoform X2 [Polistes canadensis]
MFGKKKEPKRQSRSGNLEQYGIFQVPDHFDDLGASVEDEDDEDLEAELAALTNNSNVMRKQKPKIQRVDSSELNAMVSESIKDIDEDVSDGEDDPDLLEELNMITKNEATLSDEEVHPEEEISENNLDKANDSPIDDKLQLLQDRLTLYQKAEKKAKQQNETSKARRFGRGVKTLQQLLKDAQSGIAINEADVPPPLPPSATSESTEQPTDNDVSSKMPEENPSPPSLEHDADSESAPAEPAAPVVQIDQEALTLLKKRQQEYKVAALAWKKAGNMQEAMQYVKIAKQFDIVVAAINAGEAIDLSDMPPTPIGPSASAVDPASRSVEKEDVEIQQHAEPDTPAANKMDDGVLEQRYGIEDIESALKERLEVYKRTKAAAETEGNSSKARRYGRICKQFEEALKNHARGRPVPLDELPTPPGFSPLSTSTQSAGVPVTEGEKEDDKSKLESNSEGTSGIGVPSPPPRRNQVNKNQKHATTRADKQMIQLQQRQHELKQAALKAKKDGDLELARDYLRQAKGIQPLIQASIAGLPVDMNSIPLSPVAKMELSAHGLTGQTDENFQLVNSEDCLEESGGSDEQIYDNLENQLIKQIKWCLSTRDHSKQLGDVPGYNRWERLALGYTRDLDMLRVRRRDSLPPPLHHYETKTYAIVQSCTDLNDSDIEISIIRGINYAREADTYVMFEFPYPSDNPPADRTSTIKGTCNPEYQAVFPITGILDRTSRQCQRSFKRHALKCQVWAKGCSLNPILCCTHPRGFFRSDSLLGTVTVKLHPLEMKCILHDSFPLMEGRKPTGGKLELKIRLRNPILAKQIEQITDKWLILDN